MGGDAVYETEWGWPHAHHTLGAGYAAFITKMDFLRSSLLPLMTTEAPSFEKGRVMASPIPLVDLKSAKPCPGESDWA